MTTPGNGRLTRFRAQAQGLCSAGTPNGPGLTWVLATQEVALDIDRPWSKGRQFRPS
jgi:hypothetical protein